MPLQRERRVHAGGDHLQHRGAAPRCEHRSGPRRTALSGAPHQLVGVRGSWCRRAGTAAHPPGRRRHWCSSAPRVRAARAVRRAGMRARCSARSSWLPPSTTTTRALRWRRGRKTAGTWPALRPCRARERRRTGRVSCGAVAGSSPGECAMVEAVGEGRLHHGEVGETSVARHEQAGDGARAGSRPCSRGTSGRSTAPTDARKDRIAHRLKACAISVEQIARRVAAAERQHVAPPAHRHRWRGQQGSAPGRRRSSGRTGARRAITNRITASASALAQAHWPADAAVQAGELATPTARTLRGMSASRKSRGRPWSSNSPVGPA